MVGQRTGNCSAGEALLVMAGQEFGSQDMFLANPRKELSVTWCSHSSVTFSPLLILWCICLLYFWTLVFISSVLLWGLVFHRVILILCCGTSSYPLGRTSVTNTNCSLTLLKDPHSSVTGQSGTSLHPQTSLQVPGSTHCSQSQGWGLKHQIYLKPK